MTNRKRPAPRAKEPAALQVLINALFEFGDILFEPDGLNGPLSRTSGERNNDKRKGYDSNE